MWSKRKWIESTKDVERRKVVGGEDASRAEEERKRRKGLGIETRSDSSIINTKKAERARSITTINDVKSISNSSVILMESVEAVYQYFGNNHNVKIIGFEDISLEKTKVTLASLDDVFKEFPEIKSNVRQIEYSKKLEAYGEWNSSGTIRIGRKGLGDYGTGIHEGAHALDYARTVENISYAESIVETARKNLGYRKNGKEYGNALITITGTRKDAKDPAEVFAYSIEMAKCRTNIDLANEIYKLIR